MPDHDKIPDSAVIAAAAVALALALMLGVILWEAAHP
jgi:hypothetical protein